LNFEIDQFLLCYPISICSPTFPSLLW